MRAAGRAAKNKGPLPPQLWKVQHASPPTWAEYERMSYREMVQTVALQNTYDVVKLWATGKASTDPQVLKHYAELVKEGIVGKDI